LVRLTITAAVPCFAGRMVASPAVLFQDVKELYVYAFVMRIL